MKCACAMTTAELLSANTSGKALRAILIEDHGSGWTVTPYYPAQAGLGTEHVTLQSAIQAVEDLMVKIRRDETPEHDPLISSVVTEPQEISDALMKPVG